MKCCLNTSSTLRYIDGAFYLPLLRNVYPILGNVSNSIAVSALRYHKKRKGDVVLLSQGRIILARPDSEQNQSRSRSQYFQVGVGIGSVAVPKRSSFRNPAQKGRWQPAGCNRCQCTSDSQQDSEDLLPERAFSTYIRSLLLCHKYMHLVLMLTIFAAITDAGQVHQFLCRLLAHYFPTSNLLIVIYMPCIVGGGVAGPARSPHDITHEPAQNDAQLGWSHLKCNAVVQMSASYSGCRQSTILRGCLCLHARLVAVYRQE